jgi:GDP-4-dehydro-6-deoxy-D-mannose reductase
MGDRKTPDPVWVTGGSGFTGGHLRRELERRGHRVLNIDRRGTGPDYLDLDLANSADVLAALDARRPAAVLHLAAQSSGRVSLDQPVETMQNNISTTQGLLEAIRSMPPETRPRLLSVGSCEEYGFVAHEDELPLGEDQPLRPSNPYAVSKAAQTLLCQQYRRTWGLEVLAIRAFTHTGPGQDDRFVFSSWARQIAEIERGGGRLQVGNLAVSRDISDVRDIARQYADLVAIDWPYDVVNLCSGRETSLEEVLELLRESSTAEIVVEVDPARLRPADVPRFVGNPSRLRELTGWVPSTPLKSTLADLLEDWRARLA